MRTNFWEIVTGHLARLTNKWMMDSPGVACDQVNLFTGKKKKTRRIDCNQPVNVFLVGQDVTVNSIDVSIYDFSY